MLYNLQTPKGKIGFSVSGHLYQESVDYYFTEQKSILEDAEGAHYILEEVKKINVGGQEAIEIPNRVSGNYESVLIFAGGNNFIYHIDFPLNMKILMWKMRI